MATVSAPNPLKELFKAGKVALGMNVRAVRSVDIARIAKTSGHDFIFIKDDATTSGGARSQPRP